MRKPFLGARLGGVAVAAVLLAGCVTGATGSAGTGAITDAPNWTELDSMTRTSRVAGFVRRHSTPIRLDRLGIAPAILERAGECVAYRMRGDFSVTRRAAAAGILSLVADMADEGAGENVGARLVKRKPSDPGNLLHAAASMYKVANPDTTGTALIRGLNAVGGAYGHASVIDGAVVLVACNAKGMGTYHGLQSVPPIVTGMNAIPADAVAD